MVRISALILLVTIFFSCSKSENRNEEKPNVIFILVDDLGWKDVGFMGSTFYETPNINRIAENGIYFTNAYAACAVCSPTRASILTGKYPARIGITDWMRGSYQNVNIPKDKKYPTGYDTLNNKKLLTPKNPYWMKLEELTIAEILKGNGYKTGFIGKWHLGSEEWYPEKQGFDLNIGGTDFGQPPSYFDPYTNGSFNIHNLQSRKNGEYLTDRESYEAEYFIRENKEKPFFLYLCHYAVHTPLQAKEDLIEKYQNKSKSDEKIVEWVAERDEYTARFGSREPLDGQRNPTYAAMIESIDKSVENIYKSLDELELTDNTIIFFFSDNGGHIVATDNSPLRLGKGHPYEGGIRVPLAVSWPKKIIPNQKASMPIISNDFLPTICNLTSSNLPECYVEDGIDFSPVLYGNSIMFNRNLYWHFPHYWWGDKVSPYSIIRSGNKKLIYFWEENRYELYDLEHDISEKNNLVNVFPETVESLKNDLNKWLNSVGAKLPKKNETYQ